MILTGETIEEIFRHAAEAYPYECCGIITGDEHVQTVHRCENIQNRLHAEDPVRYPRDARTAYMIDRKEFESIVSNAKGRGKAVLAFYHSHPEHEAYFSEDDAAAQAVFGEPEFPDALQVVISLMKSKVHDMKCFKWDAKTEHFVAVTCTR